jgi:hypothetical protein
MELDEKKYYTCFHTTVSSVVIFYSIGNEKSSVSLEISIIKKVKSERSTLSPLSGNYPLVGGFDTGLGKSKIGTKMETVNAKELISFFAMDISKSMLAEDVALAD